MKRVGLLVLWCVCMCGLLHAQLPMNIVLLGDSNTWIGGDECDKPQGWNKWFKDLASPLSCHSYARSGATWTHTSLTDYDTEEDTGVLSDNNVVYNQINRLKEAYQQQKQVKPDLIIVMAGTNDLWFADKRPDSLSTWIRYDARLLKEAFPESRVILVTPPPFVKVTMERQHQAADEIAACGSELGFDVVRLDQGNLRLRASSMVRKGYSKDGVHTTSKGARVLGKYIYEQVEQILRK